MELMEIFVSLARDKAIEVVDIVKESKGSDMQWAFASYATGAQFGLELAARHPGLASLLLDAMHEDNQNASSEFYTNADQFAARAREER